MLSKRLPEDIWNLIIEFGGIPLITIIPLICTDTKNAFQSNPYWEKQCRLHFPDNFYSTDYSEKKEVNWLGKFQELEEKNYPVSKRAKYLFRTVKEGILSSLKKINPTLDELVQEDKTNHSLITWANKFNHQTIANYFCRDIAQKQLAPNTIENINYFNYLVRCNQSEELQMRLDENLQLFSQVSYFLFFRLSIIHGSVNVIPIFLKMNPDFAHINFSLIPEGRLALNDLGSAHPLYLSAFYGHTEIAEILLNCGVDVDGTDTPFTPLYMAIAKNHLHVAKLLLKHGADVNRIQEDGSNETPFMLAAFKGYIEIVEMELPSVTNIDQISRTGFTSLAVATQEGHEAIVKLLLTRGANIHLPLSDRMTVLFLAARGGHLKIVGLFLKLGVRVDGEFCTSPLQIAAERGYVEIVNLLIEYNANVNKVDNASGSALIVSAQNGYFEIVKLLCENGANINHQLSNGMSALHLASKNGYLSIVEYLISKDADVNIEMIDTALKNNHIQVADVLRRKLTKETQKLVIDKFSSSITVHRFSIFHTNFLEWKKTLEIAKSLGNSQAQTLWDKNFGLVLK